MPVIAEFNRNGIKGDEVLTMVGDFANVKQFLVYRVGYGIKQAAIATDAAGNRVLDNQQAAIVLPPGLPYDYYSVWAVNESGVASEPISLNKAEIRWVQKVIRPGETGRILGRNLAENFADGTNNANVYFQNVATNAVTQATVTRVNPYCIEYTVPALTANQEYDLYVHNRHGGTLGLSKPYRITTSAAIVWGPTLNLQAKATGDLSDVERFERTWAAAKTANNFSQIPVNSTLYFHRPAEVAGGSKIRLIGNSKTTAKILPGKSATDATYTASSSGLFNTIFGLNTVHFENLTFDLQGRLINQFLNGITIKGSQSVKFINCDLKFYGVQPVNIENSNDTHFISCNTEGRIFYVGNANQTFLINCHGKQSHDATSYAQIWGGDGFFAYGCTTQDYNPNSSMDNPDGYGMGRMFSGNGVFGGQINWHVENCNGIGLTPRRGIGSDPNSGEIYMWEGNQCRASDFPTNISGDGKTFTLNNVKDLGTIGRSWAVITKGTGLGQYNKVVSRTANSVTVENEWAIKPDSTSLIMVGHFSYNLVFYKSNGSGKTISTDIDYVNASSLIKPFGGALDTVFDTGLSEGTRTCIEPFVTVHNQASEGGFKGFELIYWSFFNRITGKDNLYGINNQLQFNHTGEKAGATCLLGTTFRNISIQNPKSKQDVIYLSAADLSNGNRLMVFDNCEFTYDEDLKELRGSAKGTVYHKTRKFTGVV